MDNKFYYIVAILDEKGTEVINNLQKAIGIEFDILNDIPHITVSTYINHKTKLINKRTKFN